MRLLSWLLTNNSARNGSIAAQASPIHGAMQSNKERFTQVSVTGNKTGPFLRGGRNPARIPSAESEREEFVRHLTAR
jgi:hypothetical protein